MLSTLPHISAGRLSSLMICSFSKDRRIFLMVWIHGSQIRPKWEPEKGRLKVHLIFPYNSENYNDLFTRLQPQRTWNGPRKSKPNDMRSALPRWTRSLGKSAIYRWQRDGCECQHMTHFARTLFTAKLPWVIQNLSRMRDKRCSLQEWPDPLW